MRLKQPINCTLNIQRTNSLVQIKTARKKANSSRSIDHIVSNLDTEKVLITDVFLCLTLNDHDAPYAIIKIPTASFQTRYKYTRNMKNFTKEYYTDFSTVPFSTVYSCDNPDDHLVMLNKLTLNCTDCHAPLKRTKFTRPPAPWTNQLDIIELQKQRDKNSCHTT